MIRALAISALALPALLLAAPEVASACAVCGGGQTEEVRYAFLWTAGLLSALPLALIGGVVWFLRRRVHELEARNAPAEPRPVAIRPRFSGSSSSR